MVDLRLEWNFSGMPPQHEITEEGLRLRAVRITYEEPDEELTYDGATAELKFAAAFVDQKDERKPIVLVISDQKRPVENGRAKFSYFFLPIPWRAIASCEGG